MPSAISKTTRTMTSSGHPTYLVMVQEAIEALKERKGSSRQALLKYLVANYKLDSSMNSINSYLKAALRSGLEKNLFKKVGDGVGISGRFKVVPQKPKTAAKKPKAEKAAKATPKKTTKAKAKATAKATAKVTASKGPQRKATAKPKSPAKKTKAKAPKKASSAASERAKPKPKSAKAGSKPKKARAKKAAN